MQIVTNHRLIKRNARLGNIFNLVGLALMGVSIYLSFRGISGAITVAQFNLFLLAVLVGFIILQIGTYYGNRWGRSPRPDELIDRALKGLGREYTIYHYTTPAYHLLLGPAGLWVLLPYHQAGRVTYEKKRWILRGGGFLQTYLRIFGQEGLGRPDLEARAETTSVRRFLARNLSEETSLPDVHALMVFLNPKVELRLDEAPLPAVQASRLKDFLRERAKGKPIAPEALEAIRNILPQPEAERR
ncbi:MAG: hypothetical protein ABWK53_05760 [Anaerolineales bacterium]